MRLKRIYKFLEQQQEEEQFNDEQENGQSSELSQDNLTFYRPEKEENIIKEYLHPDVWNADNSMKDEIRQRLLTLGKDVFNSLGVGEKVELEDLILVGSLANYNWHENSDFDIHIVFDFNQIDDNVDLVEEWLKALKKTWNEKHNIYIKNFEVEISLQDNNDKMVSSGIYSILYDKWLVLPTKTNVPDIDVEERNKIFKRISREIDLLINDYNNNLLDDIEAYNEARNIWKKIKDLRKEGLEEERGEYNPSNMAFKKLRSEGYIKKLVEFKTNVYDNIFSLK